MASRAALAVAATVALGVLGPAIAHAHVVASLNDNNRYLDLTPLADRVRLAYTVFFGDKPGSVLRQQLDRNHDGAISGDEAGAFGANLSHEVADSLRIEIDRVPTPVVWHAVDVGITPETAGGAFSVDLVAWLCLPTAQGAHEVVVRDGFHVDHPGETEVKVEDAPNVTLRRVRVGAIDDPDHDFKFVGASGPLADPGLDLAFEVGSNSRALDDGACDAAHPVRGRLGATAIDVLIALGGVVALGVGVGVRRRVRRRRRGVDRT